MYISHHLFGSIRCFNHTIFASFAGRSGLTLLILFTLAGNVYGQEKFSTDIVPLFAANRPGLCALTGCHNSSRSDNGQLHLTATGTGAVDNLYAEVVTEVGPRGSRRVNTTDDTTSLILRLPAGIIPPGQSRHAGGKRPNWGKGETDYNTTLQWIQEGAFRFLKPDNVQATVVSSSQVNLTWTFIDDGQTRFRIERRIGGGEFSFLINVENPGSRNYNDNSVNANTTYTYRVRVENSVGNSDYATSNTVTTPPGVSVEERANTEVPTHFSLEQNFPNPFNPSTKIRYALSENTRVTLIIYDVLSRAVRTLMDKQQSPGFYEIVWDGRDDAGALTPGGVYFYLLRTGQTTLTRKLVLLK
jgi:hypothetical protein